MHLKYTTIIALALILSTTACADPQETTPNPRSQTFSNTEDACFDDIVHSTQPNSEDTLESPFDPDQHQTPPNSPSDFSHCIPHPVFAPPNPQLTDTHDAQHLRTQRTSNTHNFLITYTYHPNKSLASWVFDPTPNNPFDKRNNVSQTLRQDGTVATMHLGSQCNAPLPSLPPMPTPDLLFKSVHFDHHERATSATLRPPSTHETTHKATFTHKLDAPLPSSFTLSQNSSTTHTYTFQYTSSGTLARIRLQTPEHNNSAFTTDLCKPLPDPRGTLNPNLPAGCYPGTPFHRACLLAVDYGSTCTHTLRSPDGIIDAYIAYTTSYHPPVVHTEEWLPDPPSFQNENRGEIEETFDEHNRLLARTQTIQRDTDYRFPERDPNTHISLTNTYREDGSKLTEYIYSSFSEYGTRMIETSRWDYRANGNLSSTEYSWEEAIPNDRTYLLQHRTTTSFPNGVIESIDDRDYEINVGWSTQYTFNANGQLTSRRLNRGGSYLSRNDYWEYHYDAYGRLIQTNDDGDCNGVGNVYTYIYARNPNP